MTKTLIFIPTYNESANVGPMCEQILALRSFLYPVFQLVLLAAVCFERQVVLHLDLIVVVVTALGTVGPTEVGHLDVSATAQLVLNGLLCIAFARGAIAACSKQDGQCSGHNEVGNAGVAVVLHALVSLSDL